MFISLINDRCYSEECVKVKNMSQTDIISKISNERFISLGTFKKNGDKIETPVIFGIHDDKELIVSTKTFASKLKRIRNNPNIVFYPCNARGDRKGDDFQGTAKIVGQNDEQYAYNAIRKKNGIIFRLWRASGKLRHHKFVFISIKPSF